MIPKKTHWIICPQCGTRFGTIFPREDGLCISCAQKNSLISLKQSVTDRADKISEGHGNLNWIHWDNEDLVQFAVDVLILIHRSKLKLEE
jgi:NMD protein affecting ribosome stability and mRNA decay